MSDQNETAAFLIIGNEILSGRTQDKNLSFLAHELNEIGITLAECRVVRDVEDEIVSAVRQLSATHTHVFTSGGIGPTHDDITTASIGKAFGAAVNQHPEALRALKEHYAGTDIELNEARLKMAIIPDGASLIDNPVSKAPGFKLANVHVMAGVPRIFQAMVDQVLPELKHGKPTSSISISAAVREGDVAEPLAKLQAQFPEVDLGSYPYHRDGELGTSLVARSTNIEILKQVEVYLKEIVEYLGEQPFETRPEGKDGYEHAS
ncbi:MAG: competence/damage-inducible protein A [Alphaproteobacteria bacterium]